MARIQAGFSLPESPTARPLRAALNTAKVSSLLVLGDSTSDGADEWAQLAFAAVAPSYPLVRAESITNTGSGPAPAVIVQSLASDAYLQKSINIGGPYGARPTDFTGAQGFIVDVSSTDWSVDGSTGSNVASIHGTVDPNRRMELVVLNTRKLRFYRYPLGTAASNVGPIDSTVVFPDVPRLKVAVMFNPDNGANSVVSFWYKEPAGSWTALGTPVLAAPSVIAANTVSPFEVGNRSSVVSTWTGRIYSAQWWTGTDPASPTIMADWQANRGAPIHTDQYGVAYTNITAGLVTGAAMLTMLNYSVAGATSDAFDTSALAATGIGPAVVIVNLSHNDGTTRDLTKTRNLLSRIATRWPDAAVVLVAQNPQRQINSVAEAHNHRQLLKIQYALAHSMPVIDIYSAFRANSNWSTEYMADDVHPNAAGHAVAATEAVRVLRSL